jgi:ATP synthase protein I
MTQPDDLPPLDELQSRISRAKGPEPEDETLTELSGFSVAMRLSVELLAGVVVGGGLGYALDRALGTLPLFMIVCLFFGCAAGFLNLKRTADQLDKRRDSGTKPRN